MYDLRCTKYDVGIETCDVRCPMYDVEYGIIGNRIFKDMFTGMDRHRTSNIVNRTFAMHRPSYIVLHTLAYIARSTHFFPIFTFLLRK